MASHDVETKSPSVTGSTVPHVCWGRSLSKGAHFSLWKGNEKIFLSVREKRIFRFQKSPSWRRFDSASTKLGLLRLEWSLWHCPPLCSYYQPKGQQGLSCWFRRSLAHTRLRRRLNDKRGFPSEYASFLQTLLDSTSACRAVIVAPQRPSGQASCLFLIHIWLQDVSCGCLCITQFCALPEAAGPQEPSTALQNTLSMVAFGVWGQIEKAVVETECGSQSLNNLLSCHQKKVFGDRWPRVKLNQDSAIYCCHYLCKRRRTRESSYSLYLSWDMPHIQMPGVSWFITIHMCR